MSEPVLAHCERCQTYVPIANTDKNPETGHRTCHAVPDCRNRKGVKLENYALQAVVDRVERAAGVELAFDVERELADYEMVMDHCTEVYCHFSGGRISKVNTLPSEVIAQAEQLAALEAQEWEREAREDERERCCRAVCFLCRNGTELFEDFDQIAYRHRRGALEWRCEADLIRRLPLTEPA